MDILDTLDVLDTLDIYIYIHPRSEKTGLWQLSIVSSVFNILDCVGVISEVGMTWIMVKKKTLPTDTKDCLGALCSYNNNNNNNNSGLL